jgi:hypothetical protein
MTTTSTKQQRVQWTCDICHEPIADRAGYLSLNNEKLWAYEQAWREHERQQAASGSPFMDATTLLALPAAVHWDILHSSCDPCPDASAYWFTVERIRSAPQVLEWTAHLLEKNWFRCTNWDTVLRFVAKQLNDGRRVIA